MGFHVSKPSKNSAGSGLDGDASTQGIRSVEPSERGPSAAPGKQSAARGRWAERFDLIDAWRGLAALAVVVHHVAHIAIGGPAVMLFFVISGYCIAASADSCERKGLGFGRFMLRRLRRIYPPYLLSLAFWTVTRLVKLSRDGPNDLARTTVEWIQNVTLTQWLTLLFNPLPSAASNKTLFVAAYWSLCYEEQFYLLTGLMLLVTSAIGISVRTMMLVLVAAGLAWNAFFPEICYGLFIEYWALFGMGALVFHRLCRMPDRLQRRAVDLALALVLAVSVYLRWFAGIQWAADSPVLGASERAELRVVYDELAIGSAFSLLLIALRPINDHVRDRLWYRPLSALGAITFSLYLIHQFNLVLAKTLVDGVLAALNIIDRPAPGARSPVISIIMQIGVHIGMASVFWFFCERPFLNKPLLPPPSPGGAGLSGDERGGQLPPGAPPGASGSGALTPGN